MLEITHIFSIAPIDNWAGATIANSKETERVLSMMPETPRDNTVYKIPVVIGGCPELAAAYLCKADNNGTVYIFTNVDLSFIPDIKHVSTAF
jgi:hypothetical protein